MMKMIIFLKNNKNIIISSLLSLIFGIIVFCIYFDISIINPLNIDWIYCDYIHKDILQAHFAFQYYRYAPWVFPLGLFNDLSYPIYTSILNTVSIPLVAIPLKILSPILPTEFQYFGIWGLSCFVLQSLIGMIVGTIIVKNNSICNKNIILSILISLLFTLLPVLFVLCFTQSYLACHYFILLAFIPFLYEKITLKQTLWLYGIIGFLTSANNTYTLAMVGIIMFFYIIMMIIKTKNYKYLLNIAVLSIPALIVMHISGAFDMNSNLANNRFFLASFNLNGFFNTFDFCRFFSSLPSIMRESFQGDVGFLPEQSLGFSYFGIGIIALVLLSLITFLVDLIKKRIKIDDKVKFYTILSLTIFSIIIAISPRVTFNNITLFEIPYPEFLINIWSIFRGTGRFIWIADYAILIFAFSYILKRYKPKIVVLLFILAIVIQIYDLTPFYEKRYYYNPLVAKQNSLNSEFNTLFKINDDIKNVYISTYQGYVLVHVIVPAACKYNIKINNFYFSRPLIGIDKYYINSLIHANNFDLFVLMNREDLIDAFKTSPVRYFYQTNGFIVARTVPIKGMDNFEEFRTISINAVNFDNLFTLKQ